MDEILNLIESVSEDFSFLLSQDRTNLLSDRPFCIFVEIETVVFLIILDSSVSKTANNEVRPCCPYGIVSLEEFQRYTSQCNSISFKGNNTLFRNIRMPESKNRWAEMISLGYFPIILCSSH